MNTKRFSTSAIVLAAFLLGIGALAPVAALAQDIGADFPRFLKESLGIGDDLSYVDLLDSISEQFEEFRGVALPRASRYFQYPNRATVSHDTYALHVYPFRLPGGPPHLFLHLRVFREDVPSPGRFAILEWNEEEKLLVPVRVHQEIPFDEFVHLELIELDESTAGIAVGGHSGASGDVGNFTVLAYDPARGFETVWIIDAPGHQVTVIHEAKPAALSVLERAVWDASFPVTDLQTLSRAEADAYRRQFTVTYSWDRDLRTFVETGRSEVMHDFAVVNHFLKGLFAQDQSVLEIVADNPELYGLLSETTPEGQPSIFRLAGPQNRLVPLSPHTDGLAKLLGINVESGRWIALAALPAQTPAEEPAAAPGEPRAVSPATVPATAPAVAPRMGPAPVQGSPEAPGRAGAPVEAPAEEPAEPLPEEHAKIPAGTPSQASGDLFDIVDRALAFAFFEVQPGEPARIARLHYYEPRPLPDEFLRTVEYDPRPTLRFDKLAIRAWANQHGWAEANARVKRVKYVENVSDWIRVSAVLSTPLVRWVEYHYRTDLNLEPPSRAEELYERMGGLDVTPILLQLTSANLSALQPENIRVVLSDDRGNRWQGTITAGPYDAYSYLGVAIYERLFWLEFSGPQTEQEWAEIDSLTLHVIRQDRLARADLTWSFSP